MIGMITLAVIAVMIFFGLTANFFEKMGIANWVAFLIVLAFAVAAVFPPLVTGANVSLSYAGFFLPLLLSVVTWFALGANGSLVRAIVGTAAIAGIVVAARVAFAPTDGMSALPSILIISFGGGAISYIVGRTRLSMLSSVFGGIVLGDFITAMLFRFALGDMSLLELGQNGIFDSLVLAAFIGAIICESVSLAGKAAIRRRGDFVAVQTEFAEDSDIKEKDVMIPPQEDDDLFDDYFNDDVD